MKKTKNNAIKKDNNQKNIFLIISPLVLLILIIIIGCFFRISELEKKDLWLDESISAYFASKPISEYFTDQTELTPPLYGIILRLAVFFLGDSEFSLRLLSALFGIITIFMFYIMIREETDSYKALVGTFLLATSYFHIHYSQEARSYSLFGLLSLISIYLFLKVIRGDKDKIFLFILSSVLVLYTHHFGILLLFSFSLYIIIFNRDLIKKWTIIGASIFVLYLPGLILIFSHLRLIDRSGSFWIDSSYLITITTIFFEIAGNFFAGLILFILFTAGLYHSIKKKSLGCFNSLMIIIFSCFILIPLIYSILIQPILIIRYILPIIFPIYFFATIGFEKIPKYLLPIILAIFLIIPFISNDKISEPWSEIQAIRNDFNPEKIIIDPGYYIYPLQYPSRECFYQDIHVCSLNKSIHEIYMNTPLIFDLYKSERFMYIHSPEKSFHKDYFEFVKNNYNILFNKTYIVHKTYSSFEVYVFKT